MKTLKIALTTSFLSIVSSPLIMLAINHFNHEAAVKFGAVVFKVIFPFSI